MLTNEEKTKIELEEKYRNEVNAKFKTKTNIDIVEKSIKILQGLAIIVGILATYNEYRKQNEEKKQQEIDRYEQTAKEFKKFFYQKQHEYYVEAADATATLATEKIDSEDYFSARKKFYRLFWGKLSIVEDKCVEEKMLHFETLLRLYEDHYNGSHLLVSRCNGIDTIRISNLDQEDLQQASLRLAHDASRYTINIWLDSTERKNYNR